MTIEPWIMRTVVVLGVMFGLLLLLLWLSARRAPTCTCGDPDCGGGCLRRRGR